MQTNTKQPPTTRARQTTRLSVSTQVGVALQEDLLGVPILKRKKQKLTALHKEL